MIEKNMTRQKEQKLPSARHVLHERDPTLAQEQHEKANQ